MKYLAQGYYLSDNLLVGGFEPSDHGGTSQLGLIDVIYLTNVIPAFFTQHAGFTSQKHR